MGEELSSVKSWPEGCSQTVVFIVGRSSMSQMFTSTLPFSYTYPTSVAMSTPYATITLLTLGLLNVSFKKLKLALTLSHCFLFTSRGFLSS